LAPEEYNVYQEYLAMSITIKSIKSKVDQYLLVKFMFILGVYTLVVFILYLLFKFDFRTEEHLSNSKLLIDILKIRPSAEYLSDVAAFIGVVIAIVLPFGTDIIIKIGEKYNSEVIPNRFRQEWSVIWLLPSLLVLIGVAIGLRFFITDSMLYTNLWRALCVATIVYFVLVLALLAKYISRLNLYAHDKPDLKKEIEESISQSINDNNRAEFKKSVEAYGDFMVAEASKYSANNLESSLKFIEFEVRKIFSKDIEPFERFILNDLYKGSTEEAQLRFVLNPDEFLQGFTILIEQIMRVYYIGIKSKNGELTRAATYSLVRTLNIICSQSQREVFVRSILNKLRSASIVSMQKNDEAQYSATYQWYFTVAYSNYSSKHLFFQNEYYGVFDEYLISAMREVIKTNNSSVMEAFVAAVVDGRQYNTHAIQLTNYSSIIIGPMQGEAYKKFERDFNFTNRILDLESTLPNIDSISELENWQQKFEDLHKELKKSGNLSNTNKELKDVIAGVNNEALNAFQYNNIQEMIFTIGAYCIFQRRTNMIKMLWEYKQPADSDVTWIGPDIVPDNVADVSRLYFKKALHERRRNWWEGHHGSEIYYKRYFILLIFRNAIKNPDSRLSIPEGIQSYRVNDIVYSIDDLKEVCKQLGEDLSLFEQLGYSEVQVGKTILKITELLDELKETAEQTLARQESAADISSNMVESFKKGFLESYTESVLAREIYKYAGTYVDNSKIPNKKALSIFGINTIMDKAAFIEDWHVDYSSIYRDFGRQIAIGENQEIIKKLIGASTRSNFDLASTLTTLRNKKNMFILTTRGVLIQYFSTESKGISYRPQWEVDPSDPMKKNHAFAGYISIFEDKIPVFELDRGTLDDSTVLITNKKGVGQLTQTAPSSNEEMQANIGAFFFDVEALTGDSKQLAKLLEKVPEWLQKIGKEEDQKKYLQAKVAITIQERFDLSIQKDSGTRIIVELDNKKDDSSKS
jgi:hypothetical protein